MIALAFERLTIWSILLHPTDHPDSLNLASLRDCIIFSQTLLQVLLYCSFELGSWSSRHVSCLSCNFLICSDIIVVVLSLLYLSLLFVLFNLNCSWFWWLLYFLRFVLHLSKLYWNFSLSQHHQRAHHILLCLSSW